VGKLGGVLLLKEGTQDVVVDGIETGASGNADPGRLSLIQPEPDHSEPKPISPALSILAVPSGLWGTLKRKII